MDKLTYETLDILNYDGYLLRQAPEKVIQFGEGNFLRGFVDYFIDLANERGGFNGKVAVVQPIPAGRIGDINRQEGLYTLCLRGRDRQGIRNEKRIISCISRGIDPYEDFPSFLELARNEEMEYIVSNTTEAGIVYDGTCRFSDQPAGTFPAKLTRLLYERFSRTASQRGFIILSCELIDDNGKKLKDCVLSHSRDWDLGPDFIQWVEQENRFCSTLVDRIVTGYPADPEEENGKNGYEDVLMDAAEFFGLWVIEGTEDLEGSLPFTRAGLPILVKKDHKPYKTRKVRILNGAHTCLVPVARLAGKQIVRESMEDEKINQFVRTFVFQEVIPTLDLPEEDLRQFAEDVFDRFANPFIDHKLTDIALNSISKWTARIKPSLKEYAARKGTLPACTVFALAALIVYYKHEQVRDDEQVLAFFRRAGQFQTNEALVHELLEQKDFFQEDLSKVQGLVQMTAAFMDEIESRGMAEALAGFLKEC